MEEEAVVEVEAGEVETMVRMEEEEREGEVRNIVMIVVEVVVRRGKIEVAVPSILFPEDETSSTRMNPIIVMTTVEIDIVMPLAEGIKMTIKWNDGIVVMTIRLVANTTKSMIVDEGVHAVHRQAQNAAVTARRVDTIQGSGIGVNVLTVVAMTTKGSIVMTKAGQVQGGVTAKMAVVAKEKTGKKATASIEVKMTTTAAGATIDTTMNVDAERSTIAMATEIEMTVTIVGTRNQSTREGDDVVAVEVLASY